MSCTIYLLLSPSPWLQAHLIVTVQRGGHEEAFFVGKALTTQILSLIVVLTECFESGDQRLSIIFYFLSVFAWHRNTSLNYFGVICIYIYMTMTLSFFREKIYAIK